MSIESVPRRPVRSPAADTVQLDRQYCWDHVVRVRPEIRLTRFYSTQPDRLLSLYALLSAFEEVHTRIGDESVARAKLAWWHGQLVGRGFHSSEHPICRSLDRTGGVTPEEGDALQELLTNCSQRLDGSATVNEAELKLACFTIGLHAMRLELGRQLVPQHNSWLAGACAVNGLMQLLRESICSRHPGKEYTWIPLTMLARHKLSHVDLSEGAQPVRFQHLVRQLDELAESWLGSSESSLVTMEEGRIPGQLWIELAGARHWYIQSELQRRLLRKMAARKSISAAYKLVQTGIADAWFIWRCARRFDLCRRRLEIP